MKTKYCKKCHKYKKCDNFAKCSRNKNGLQSSCRLCKAKYHKNRREHYSKKKKELYIENSSNIKTKSSEYYNNNKESQCNKQKEYYRKNSDKIKRYQKKYRDANKEKILVREKLSLKNNIQRKIAHAIRTRVNIAIKSKYRAGSAVKSLGCSIGDLIIYLESKFECGMSWDNWGRNGWHIDHIVPLSYYDLSNQKELSLACHYSNLQPMWAKENLSKGSRI